MKRAILIFALLAPAAWAQTTTITGTLKDLTGALVTSGKVVFSLQPFSDTTISGVARYSSTQVVCLINGSGLITSLSGGTCTVATNTALNPPGSYYKVDVWPYSVKTSSFTFYAVLASYDWSTVVPTPTTVPAQNFVDVFSNQTIGGNKTFSGTTAFNGGVSVTGTFSATGAASLSSTLSAAGLITATSGLSSAGPISAVNAGIFTNTQQNEYLSSVVGGMNLGTEFSALQGANFATEGLGGGVALPLGATVHNGNGIAGYASSACNSLGRTVCNVVGVYGQGRDIAGGNGAGIWGGNVVAVATGASATNTNLTGFETDVNLAAGAVPFWVVGHIITGAGTGTMPAGFAPGASTAISGAAAEAIIAPRLGGSSSYTWPVGLDFFRGAVSGAAVQIDGTCIAGGVPCSSATLTFTGWDGGNVAHTAQMYANSTGDIVLNPASGRGVSISTGTNVVFRCVTAGATLPVGSLTINSGACGSTQDTGLRVP